jgi:hypothetical protein
MNVSKHWAVAILAGMTTWSALAQTAGEHAQHHPDGTAQAPASAQAPAPSPDTHMAAMDMQLQRMRELSRKLAEAKTPQERQALMTEHHKAMQDGMKLMEQVHSMPMSGMGMMGGGGMAGAASSGTGAPMMGQMMQRHAMMEKRMDMMQAMMQMMMDRMPTQATK